MSFILHLTPQVLLDLSVRNLSHMVHRLANVQEVEGKTFDYIIIGGGTAGSVLADRLSENEDFSVVVLEAGQARFDDALVTSVMSWSRQLKNAEHDWLFPIEPQPQAKNAQDILWSRAKTLGGSSTMNAMIYTKPGREEMDALETLGNPGWNWDSYQKYAKKAERMCTPEAGIPDKEYRDLYNADSVGHDGPVSISFVRTGCGAEVAFQRSLETNGLRVNSDALGGDVVGIYKSASTINQPDGTRSDAATSYLLPVLGRSNLKVLTGAHVLRILLNEKGHILVASGVEFQHEGHKYTVLARREVILSAGAIKTPQVLELSGIGDRNILGPLGIPVLNDLPAVGNNAQEHILCTAPMFRMKEDSGVFTAGMLKNPEFAHEIRQNFGIQGEYNIVTNAFAFAPVQVFSDKAQSVIDKKKAQLAQSGTGGLLSARSVMEMQLHLLENARVADGEFFVSSNAPVPDTSRAYIAIPPVLSHPWSRGSVHITSVDPLENPKINPGYLEDDTDLELLVESYKYACKISQTSPFKDLIDVQVKPSPNVDLSDDNKLRQFVSENITSIWHTCGTASMLPKESGGAVDHKLIVYGTTNLRVVDLSTLPLHIAAHPQSYVYSLAERAADMIKDVL